MRYFTPLVSIIGFLLIWALAAFMVADVLLPGPVEVWSALYREISTGVLWHHMFATLWRVLASLFLR